MKPFSGGLLYFFKHYLAYLYKDISIGSKYGLISLISEFVNCLQTSQ